MIPLILWLVWSLPMADIILQGFGWPGVFRLLCRMSPVIPPVGIATALFVLGVLGPLALLVAMVRYALRRRRCVRRRRRRVRLGGYGLPGARRPGIMAYMLHKYRGASAYRVLNHRQYVDITPCHSAASPTYHSVCTTPYRRRRVRPGASAYRVHARMSHTYCTAVGGLRLTECIQTSSMLTPLHASPC